MKKTLLSLVLISVFLVDTDNIRAQQDPYTTHYAFNRMMYNPAVAGQKGLYCVTALSHYQYLGYEDRTVEFWPDPDNPTDPKYPDANKGMGPKTQMFSFCAPITRYGGLGIGFINDKLGYESSTHIKIDAAGRLPLGNDPEQKNNPYLSLGFEANILQKGLNGDELRPLAKLDPSIPGNKVSDRNTVFGAGAYYINPMLNSVGMRNLWVGVSALNLNSPEYTYGTSSHTHPEMHTYLMGGVTMIDFLGKQELAFHPSVMVKYNSVPQVDFTALAEYQNKLWGGLAYRTTADALSIMLGYSGFGGNFQGLRIGYSYDLTLSKILSVSSGTHEIQLNYCFEIKYIPPPKINIVTPPFMHRESD
jgi:type IX secretion system PorP/SprF family membrane protein